MIHITSEGNLFTSFLHISCSNCQFLALDSNCTDSATVFHSVILFLLVNCNLFASKKKKKKKKQCCRTIFVCHISAAGLFSSGLN